jgi:hypothetical protein
MIRCSNATLSHPPLTPRNWRRLRDILSDRIKTHQMSLMRWVQQFEFISHKSLKSDRTKSSVVAPVHLCSLTGRELWRFIICCGDQEMAEDAIARARAIAAKLSGDSSRNWMIGLFLCCHRWGRCRIVI